MKLLALETSSNACSVALQYHEERLVDHRIVPQQHAKLLLPMIDKLLSDAGIRPEELDGVAFGCGPGSFTGVRIAAATAQGIAFGADVGVVPVSSLASLAQSVVRTHNATHVFAALDARMGEVYWGAYVVKSADDDVALVSNVLEDCVCAPTAVKLPEKFEGVDWMLIGSGAETYLPEISAAIEPVETLTHVADCWPNANDILSMALPDAKAGNFVTPANALPVYLRNRIALTEKERASGEKL